MNHTKMNSSIFLFLLTLLANASFSASAKQEFPIKRRIIQNEDFECQRDQNAFYITCKNIGNREHDWKNFPDCGLLNLSSHYPLIKFENCTLTPDMRIVDITTRFNISALRYQLINVTSKITKEHFQGVSIKKLYISKSTFNVSQDLLYDLHIKYFEMVKTNLDVIPNNFFDKSTELDDLKIWTTTLIKIRQKDLAELKNLTVLDFTINKNLTEIEAGAFDSLVSVKRLNLIQNKLATLPPGIFKKLKSLNELFLSGNKFDNLPNNLLDIEGKKLKRFILVGNSGKLSSLPGGFFTNLTSMRIIDLSNNQFTSVPEDLFIGATSLLKLVMKENKLKELPVKFFQTTTALRFLDLSENELEELDERLFENIYLDVLNLNKNRFKRLSSKLDMPDLTELLIANNNLEFIEHEFCKKAPMLRKLDLSKNKLKLEEKTDGPWSKSLVECENLVDLNLSYNNISKFPYWESYIRQYVPGRRIVDLQYNQFTEMNYNIAYGYFGTIEVKLAGNNLSTINFDGITQSSDDDWLDPDSKLSIDTVFEITDIQLVCDCRLKDFINFLHKKLDINQNIANYYLRFIDKNVTCSFPPKWRYRTVSSILASELGCERTCSDVCTCVEYTDTNVWTIDCANKNLSTIKTVENIFLNFENISNHSVELNLSGNMLRETPSMKSFTSVTSLDLSDNKLSTVSAETISDNLRVLKLHNNSIKRLDEEVIEKLKHHAMNNLTLHDNPWICECKSMNLVKYVMKNFGKFNFTGVMCEGTTRQVSLQSHFELCLLYPIIIIFSISILGAIFGTLAALYYKNKKKIKIWLYSKQWCLWFVTENELDKDKEYDAFISFSHKDEAFVNEHIVKRLESGPKPYKLCLHYRDWLAGEWIPAQIAHSVEESRRTIIVLSPNFIESIWGRMEFRTAHNQALSEGRARVIVILYGDIGNLDNLDQELKAYLSMNTYIEWGDPWFWDKLRYALPHKYEQSKFRKRNTELIEKQLEHLEQIPLHIPSNGDQDKSKKIIKPNEDSNLESESLLHVSA